jgi:murein DD-endopeptidase MepM/ murein hydrolase activator NlpD
VAKPRGGPIQERRAKPGAKTQERIGKVGKTGNAQSVGCQLHFELRRRGDPIDPEPFLREWDRYS